MPTYEYRCPDGHEFEKFVQKISLASAELPCPVCGKMAERRISAGGGFVFKGSGFYITDYGKDGKKDLRANAAAVTANSEKSAAPKSDANSSGDSGTSKSGEASSAGDAASARDGSKREPSKGQGSAGEGSKSEGSRGDRSKGEAPKGERAKNGREKSDAKPAPSVPKGGSSDK